MKQSGKVTINEVASAARVSPKTVSRVVNGEENVAQETRRRVQRAIEALGYRPNAAARSLVRRRSQTIGVFISNDPDRTFANPFHSEVLQGIGAATTGADYQLQLVLSGDTSACVDFVESGQVDGIVVMSLGMDAPLVDNLLERRLPFVLTCRHNNPQAPSVHVDDVEGADLAVSYLISLGHKRIGMVNGSVDAGSTRDRLAGYKHALAKHGIPFDPKLVVNTPHTTEEAGLRAASELLLAAPDLTAIFVIADIMAIGVMRALDRAGRRIPEDVSVVGFDDISISRYLRPPLTSVRHRGFEKGKTAAEILIAMVEGRTSGIPHVVLDPELVVRQSTAQAREVR